MKPSAASKSPAKSVASPSDILEADFLGAFGVGSPLDPTALASASAEIAFAGRSNVGKSSLINVLVQRKSLVRTSATPGCTRQINLFTAKARDGVAVTLVDLPGYGFAKRSHAERNEWASLIEGYLSHRPSLRTLVLIVDVRRGLEPDDLELIEFGRAARKKPLAPLEIVVVATKVDRAQQASIRTSVERIRSTAAAAGTPGITVVPFSAVTRSGREAVWSAIRRVTGLPALPTAGKSA
ncbi:MAG: ribosome biogenesis GTP-binding protein YihA/YsxC [Polyangiaceae bacterium]